MTFFTNRYQLYNVQSASTCCTCCVVLNHIICYVMFVLNHLGIHTRKYNSVLQFKTSQFNWRKQCIITHFEIVLFSFIIK